MKIRDMIVYYVIIAKIRANICETEAAIRCRDMSLNYNNKSVLNNWMFGTSVGLEQSGSIEYFALAFFNPTSIDVRNFSTPRFEKQKQYQN